MAAKTGYLKQGGADKMWNGCPTVLLPEHAYGFCDDFETLAYGDVDAPWTLDNDTMVPVLGSAETVGLGGVLDFGTATDNQWATIKRSSADTGAAYKITKDSGKKLWLGCRVKNTVIDECSIYFGLFEQGVTEPMADATGAENLGVAEDGVYWRCLLHATSDDWDCCHAKNGTEVEAAAAQLTSDTDWHVLGVTFNGASLVQWWADDVAVHSVAADATNFPHDVGLTVLFSMKVGESVQKNVYVDWIKCVQLR